MGGYSAGAIKELCSLIDASVDKMVGRYRSLSPPLYRAMQYATLEGKRARPLLLLMTARLYDSTPGALVVAAALECMHTYTLIHDDLPLFDDDAIRRGRPSCHVAFGETTALLAGNALMTLGFDSICMAETLSDAQKVSICRVLASTFSAVMAGQELDIALSAKTEVSPSEIESLFLLKTAKPFIAACECGHIAGKGSPAELPCLLDYALNLGMAYQLADDIIDHKEQRKGVNVLDKMGREWTFSYMRSVLEKADQALGLIKKDTKELRGFLLPLQEVASGY